MSEPLKNIFNRKFFDQLSFAFEKSLPLYNHEAFLSTIFTKEWKQYELKTRVRHIANALHPFLPSSFPKAVPQLIAASRLLREKRQKEYGYFCIFFCDYVEVYGLEHFEESMKAIEELTQLSSAEFCIRQFILKYPEKTMAQLLKWSKHPNADVRRLSSEGCRPRLPWAIALTKFKADPSPVLSILENLKTDESEYVRRSVANNLNDIAKDNPAVVLAIVKKWKGSHPFTDAILKHGCRSLLKKGDKKTLALLGFKTECQVAITNMKLSKNKIKIGDNLAFSFDMKVKEKKSFRLRLEYAIDYMKSNGKTSRKVFKISEGEFAPGKIYSLERRQRFTDFTTRKHYPGKHQISIIVNGKECNRLPFELKRP